MELLPEDRGSPYAGEEATSRALDNCRNPETRRSMSEALHGAKPARARSAPVIQMDIQPRSLWVDWVYFGGWYRGVAVRRGRGSVM